MLLTKLKELIGGVRRDKADQASAEARHLLQQPGVMATLFASLKEHVQPGIQRDLAISRQLDIVAEASRYESNELAAAAPGGDLAAELLELNSITGVSQSAQLEALLGAPRCNPFTGEPMENTDATILRNEASDRLSRHVRGNYLNADKGFCCHEPPPSKKKETPIVIGPKPRKVAATAKKQLKEQQQAKWALGKAGVIMGPWDVASPHDHVLFSSGAGKPLRVWLPALNVQKAKAWPALVELLKLSPWGLGDGGSLGLLPLEGHTIRRNVLLSPDGSREIRCDAFGVDAFGDARMIYEAPATTSEAERTGASDVACALRQRLKPLFLAGFLRGYYPFDVGDLNPYKWVTFYSRAAEAFAKLSPEDQARLERAGGKLHESKFSLGATSESLKAALLDKFFGGREAALLTIGEAMVSRKLELKGIVPIGCTLTLHGVGRNPQRPLTVCVKPPVEPRAGEHATRHAGERRPVEPGIEVSAGLPSANAEGEDQLWRHAVEEVERSTNFLAFISDTDFKEAALVTLPRLLWPDGGGDTSSVGRVMVASVDRSSPQSEPYWCMNELVEAVASLPALVDGIPGDTHATRRLRCAHVAAALVLMGGDTTPAVHGLTEEAGLKAALTWAWYTGCLVEPYQYSASSPEVFRVLPDAAVRLHKVWYLVRSTPNVQKKVKFDIQRSRPAQRAWLDAISLEELATAVLQKVMAPVGIPGQPVRSAANLAVVLTLANARLLQWGLATHPDEALFHARAGLKALEGKQFGPWTTVVNWDLSETGARRRRGAAAATLPLKMSASDLFAKYGNDLSGIDSLQSKPQNERLAVIKDQLLARGSPDVKGSWKRLKALLVAVLNQEAPPPGTNIAAATAARAGAAADETTATPTAETAEVDVEMEADEEDAEDAEDDEVQPSSSEDEEDEEDEEAPPQRQRFFCCMDDKKPGGFWYCPGGCSHAFHHACSAEAKKPDGSPLDGRNKTCVPCHVATMSRGRGARGATRQRVE